MSPWVKKNIITEYMPNLIRWSHTPQITLLGVGNRIQLHIPLYCMQRDDGLVIGEVLYCSQLQEIKLSADILRRPFLSPYKNGNIEGSKSVVSSTSWSVGGEGEGSGIVPLK